MTLAISLALPLGAGCNKKDEAAEGEGGANADGAADGEAQADEPAADEAKQAGLAQSALAPTPAAGPMTKLDDLLALAPKGESYEVVGVIRDAGVFLDYVDEGTRFSEGPIKQLAAAASKNDDLKQFAGLSMAYPAVKAQYALIKDKIGSSGIKLDHGMLFAEADSRNYLIYAADRPEALGELISAFDQEAGKMTCKNTEAAGYVVCADSQGDLDAYVAAGEVGATAMRARWTAGLPGVDLEQSNIVIEAEDGLVAMQTPPGLTVISVAAPMDDAEFAEIGQTLTPAQGKLLGSVQPGAGFVWANVNRQVVNAQLDSDMSDAPKAVQDMFTKVNGELLLGGHYEPASVAMQFGLDSDDDWAGVAEAMGGEVKNIRKGLEKDMKVEGGKWSVDMVGIPVDGKQVDALHVGLSGVPEADVLAELTGLTIDGWVFAADDALHVALGATPEAIGLVATGVGSGASEGLRAYLPPTLTAAYEANQVSMIAHFPLDALHGPKSRQLIRTSLKNVEEVSPELVLSFFDLMAPLSSGTVWMTHNGGKVQVHMAVQGIGHHADQEGKDALAAAAAVTAGTEPAAAFGPLVDKYPSSPRLASYKARAGQAETALVASGVGAMVATGVLAAPFILDAERNTAMLEELDIEEGAADKAKEESKKDTADKQKDTTPTPADDDDDDESAPTPTPPTPTPTPPTPTPTPAGDDDGGDEDEGGDEGSSTKPTRPQIIPKNTNDDSKDSKPKRVR
ncbi:hypothetical protein G6O69_01985 [Pseudenhygromyxa sp. WMMC2535]|uniref:hypothetical protein n=1 Tax=Pseudenhygromyxa sp. WMMC2535 TaxID=2712867 RepID=UPI001557F455|nr:hypothetical protein [Pseudenhygromyxa sp. WMMC2535]NVB36584.1 hypothetical protein [Pseudenhygromyxa sp. WMMC2535]